MLKNLPERKRNTRRFQSRSCDLIHQGLELMVVVTVEKEYFVCRFFEVLCKPESAEARADDDDSWSGFHRF
jgi:hypothetical protein